MKVLDLTQRGEDWQKWRQGGVTATDAIILVGRSPYKTFWRLWAEKTGYAIPEDLSNNPHVIRGLRLEDTARMALEKKLGDILLPVCVESDANPTLRASLDGLTSAGEPTELKCPSETTWNDVVQHGERSEAYKLYYPQVQHQICVTGSAKGWLAFYFDGQLKVFEVVRDNGMIQEIEAQADIFWNYVQSRKEPQKDPERDIFLPKGDVAESWMYAAQEYRFYETEIQAMAARLEELREKQASSVAALKSLMGDYKHADFCGVKLTKYAVPGRVDLKKFLEHNPGKVSAEEIEKFRSARETRCRVSLSGAMALSSISDPEILESVRDLPLAVESCYF